MNETLETQSELVLRSRRWPAAVWVSMATFAAMSIWAGVRSQGFLEADACTHFLSASFGFEQPIRLVSVWDRPLFMLLYTPAAVLGGVVGARLLSLMIALLCGWCAWRIAGKLGFRRPELAMIFTLGQPLLFLHSFAEMTELVFAAVIGLAFLAFLEQRWGWMAVLLALSPLGRPEGLGFLAVGAGVLLLSRQWRWIFVLPLGLVAWTFVGWLMWGRPTYGWGALDFLCWLPKQWPYSGVSTYEAGPLLLWKKQSDGAIASSFLLRLPMLLGPLLFPFVLLGTFWSLRELNRGGGVSPWRAGGVQAWGWLAVVLLPWGILAGHSFLWWRGLMASNGELRYLLVTAPLWGVIGAWGLEAFAGIGETAAGDTVAKKRGLAGRVALIAGVLALLPALANLYFRVVPLPLYADDILARQVADWYRGSEEIRAKYPRMTASYVAVYLYMKTSPTDWGKTAMYGRKLVEDRPGDLVLVWDEINGTKNADANMVITRKDLEEFGWEEIKTFTHEGRTWHVFVAGAH